MFCVCISMATDHFALCYWAPVCVSIYMFIVPSSAGTADGWSYYISVIVFIPCSNITRPLFQLPNVQLIFFLTPICYSGLLSLNLLSRFGSTNECVETLSPCVTPNVKAMFTGGWERLLARLIVHGDYRTVFAFVLKPDLYSRGGV